MQRRAVTLIEVLIGISLLSILLFALLSSYSQLKMVDTTLAKEIHKGLDSRTLESQLQDFILKIPEAKRDTYFFYTDFPPFSSSPSLIFSYEAGSLLDPKFSGPVLGRLFVDREGNLALATWPAPSRLELPPYPMRLEVLAKGVQSIRFSFYCPPGAEMEPEPNRWHSEWKMTTWKVPPLMRIEIVKESLETLDFSFYLANNQYPLDL